MDASQRADAIHASILPQLGRGSKILLSIIGLFTVSTVLFVAIIKLMPSTALAPFYSACTCGGSALIVLAALGAFVQARRRLHLSDRALVAAGVLSCGIVAAAFVLVPENTPFVAYSLIFAFAALVVLPVASLPVVIAWNRHR